MFGYFAPNSPNCSRCLFNLSEFCFSLANFAVLEFSRWCKKTSCVAFNSSDAKETLPWELKIKEILRWELKLNLNNANEKIEEHKHSFISITQTSKRQP